MKNLAFKDTNKLIPFLASLCLFLSAVEFAIPKPLPFMRLGLANMPIILALYLLSWKEVFLLMLLKVLCQAIFAGTLFSYIFVFSITGSTASVFSMLVMYRIFGKKKLLSPVGISLAGSLANTGAQILMSRIMLFGASVRYIAPVLLFSGTLTGTILGLCTALFMNRSKWFGIALGTCSPDMPQYLNQKKLHLKSERLSKKTPFYKYLWTIALLAIGLPFLLVQKDMLILWTTVIIFAICSYFRKGRLRILTPIIIFLSVTILNLYPEYGKILYTFGNFRVTEDAIYSGLRRSGVLLGMVFLSQAAIDSSVVLPGRIGVLFSRILSYFEALTDKSFIKVKKNTSKNTHESRSYKIKNINTIIDSIDRKLLAVYQ
jgi:heptaprenyl diphosphate synthase